MAEAIKNSLKLEEAPSREAEITVNAMDAIPTVPVPGATKQQSQPEDNLLIDFMSEPAPTP